MMREIKLNRAYRHFKGNVYYVHLLAESSETGERMVVYQAMYPPYKIYVRPLHMFMSEVDKEKYPNSQQSFRFELV